MTPPKRPAGLMLLAAGGVGALGGYALGVPAGTIIGALLCSGLYRIAGGQPGPWRGRYGRGGRLLLGTVIGAAFGPDVLAPLGAALLPMAVLILALLAIGLALSWLLGRFTDLDARTALLSAMPGGLPAMTAMAEDLDADATVVAAIHFARLSTILIVTPIIIQALAGSAGTISTVNTSATEVSWQMALITLLLGIAGWLCTQALRLPTADLIGPILLVGGLRLLGAPLGPMPSLFRDGAMLLIGTSVGAQMTRQSLYLLRQVALPAAIMIAVLIASGLFLGWSMTLVTPLDLPTALLSGLPGGASTMPVIAHDLGGDMRLVAALHLTRQIVMMVGVPGLLSTILIEKLAPKQAEKKIAL